MAVLARPQGGTIHTLRTEYSPVLADPKEYDSNLMGGGGGEIERGGENEKEKERIKRK